METLWKDYLEKRASRPAPDYDANVYDELREPAYEKLFGGTALSVVTLPIPTPPFVVNVHVYDEPPPRDSPLIIMPGPLESAPRISPPRRSFTTLATLGMSNERMAVPPGTRADCCRIELAMYLDHEAVAENRDLIAFGADVLLHYAKYPFLEDTFLAPTQVIPICVIGQGQVAFLGDPTITAFLLLPPPNTLPESKLHEHLSLDGDPVRLLVLVPITAREEEFIRRRGADAFIDESPHRSAIYGGQGAALAVHVWAKPEDAKPEATPDPKAKPPARPWWRFW